MISKTNTIEAIMDLNPSANPGFLAEFAQDELALTADLTIKPFGEPRQVVTEVGEKDVVPELMEGHPRVTGKPVLGYLQTAGH